METAEMQVSPQLTEALTASGVNAANFNTTEQEMMMAMDGQTWSTQKPDGTQVTVTKNNNTSFDVQTDGV
jgi:hypothetical protein